jgi:hypothetical protein
MQPTFTRVAFNKRFGCCGVLSKQARLAFNERVNAADAGR